MLTLVKIQCWVFRYWIWGQQGLMSNIQSRSTCVPAVHYSDGGPWSTFVLGGWGYGGLKTNIWAFMTPEDYCMWKELVTGVHVLMESWTQVCEVCSSVILIFSIVPCHTCDYMFYAWGINLVVFGYLECTAHFTTIIVIYSAIVFSVPVCFLASFHFCYWRHGDTAITWCCKQDGVKVQDVGLRLFRWDSCF